MDTIYTGHRNEFHNTFSLSGISQPSINVPISKYTNAIVTCIWGDGQDHTPCILYTYNKKFRITELNMEHKHDDEKRLLSLLETYKISKNRIVVINDDTNGNRQYVSESPELYKAFFGTYKINKNIILYSDNSNAFSDGSNDILKKIGFNFHQYYPVPAHQYLSPNDNGLHGAAKGIWRQSGVNYSDDVEASIKLMNTLDAQTQLHSEQWFKRNLFNLQENQVYALIGNMKMEKCKFKKKCERLYQRNKTNLHNLT